MKRSMRRASLGDMYGATSKPFTSPAIWLERRAGSNLEMRLMPDLPARALDHASATVFPIGLTIPSPVTTTLRRFTSADSLGVGAILDVVDGLLDGGDLLGLSVRDLGVELLFERHHELDGVERVGAQVVDEGRFVLDLGLVHAELLGNDFSDPLLGVFH